MKQLEVAGAILVRDGKILCAQRGEGKYDYTSYKYEFPGGKLEEGETPKEALHRELIEEMDIDIKIDDMKTYCVVEHRYRDFEIRMYAFLCPMDSDKITLKVHVDAKWLAPERLKELDWAGADWPIVKELEVGGI
ncbi:MAG: (deoxy)nucleoside triphosphate pyrophosphohydrolase [Eubacteriaceae bacterium]|nr:(deoxy)nucleoside triphosphate pyrophosphohydrolase [Eubacteriaceae bacterium]